MKTLKKDEKIPLHKNMNIPQAVSYGTLGYSEDNFTIKWRTITVLEVYMGN